MNLPAVNTSSIHLPFYSNGNYSRIISGSNPSIFSGQNSYNTGTPMGMSNNPVNLTTLITFLKALLPLIKSSKTQKSNIDPDKTKERVIRNNDGSIKRKIKVFFDSSGKRTERTVYDANGKIINKRNFSYNSQGKLNEIKDYNTDGSLKKKIYYTYDSSGKKTNRTIYNSSGKIINKRTY